MRSEPSVVPTWNAELHDMALQSSWAAVIWQRMNFYEEALAAEQGVDLADQDEMAQLRRRMEQTHGLVWPGRPVICTDLMS